MVSLKQLNFSSGEIDPAIKGRVDQTRYQTGLATLRNAYVKKSGGVANRPGTRFIAEGKTRGDKIRLIPWVFNTDQTYILEFGNLYIRFIRNGAQVLETAVAISSVTQAPTGVVTTGAAHGYSNDEEVHIVSASSMTELNNRNFKVKNVTSTTFELNEMDGSTAVDTTLYGAYSGSGTCARVYEITTTYVSADLMTLQFLQNADVMTIAHKNYAPMELKRTGHTSWTITDKGFNPTTILGPVPGNISGSAGSELLQYAVTLVDKATGEESGPGIGSGLAIVSLTSANPGVITTAPAHGIETGDVVHLYSMVGMVEVNNRFFVATALTATTFEIGQDTTNYGTFSSGTFSRCFSRTSSLALPIPSAKVTFSFTPSNSSSRNLVYRNINSAGFGFVGTGTDDGTTASYVDDGSVIEDKNSVFPIPENPFVTGKATANRPGIIGSYQQRMILAGTDQNTEIVYASATGLNGNFSVPDIPLDSSSLSFSLVGKQVNGIKHVIDIGRLIIFTDTGEWSVNGDTSGVLTPFAINAVQHTYNGSADLVPIVSEGNILYVQARDTIIRDFGYVFDVDGYRGSDLSVFSAHLLRGFTIRDWAIQRIPDSVVWMVRSDGKALSMTYLKSHEIIGWATHDTDGLFENVTSIPSSSEDEPYFVVRRTINGNVVRYIERMETRVVNDANPLEIADDIEAATELNLGIRASVFMDSVLDYDGRNTAITTHSMTLTSAGAWTSGTDLTLTSSASYFAAGDVGNAVHILGSSGVTYRCKIIAFSSGTVVTVRADKAILTADQGAAFFTWAKAVDVIEGLWHLEGETVAIFADGFVVANPNNPKYTTLFTVVNGKITLNETYTKIIAGRPYVTDIETLDIDVVQSETMADKMKDVTELAILFHKSRGGFIAGTAPAGSSSVVKMDEIRPRKNETNSSAPVELISEVFGQPILPRWNSNGRVFIRQIDPIPMEVLAIVPSGLYPFGGS